MSGFLLRQFEELSVDDAPRGFQRLASLRGRHLRKELLCQIDQNAPVWINNAYFYDLARKIKDETHLFY